MMSNDPIIDLLTEDRELITYRKSLRKIAGSVTATILLQQMMFRAKGKDVFYKFKEPCAHSLYKPGDSWTEELGFSAKEFDNALKKIGTKITGGSSKSDALEKTDATGIVIYWTDAERVTWYQLNRDLLGKLLKGIYLVSDQREFTINPTKGSLPLVPETTTETTTEIFGKSQNSKTNGNISSPRLAKIEGLANAIAKAANTSDAALVKSATQLAVNICDIVCKLDLLTIVDHKTQSYLISVAIALAGKGVSTADLTAFSAWWYDTHWMGKKGQPPSPQLVGDSWGQFETSRLAPLSNTGSGPILTPSELAAYQALIDQENQ